jgi:hypothetical protein
LPGPKAVETPPTELPVDEVGPIEQAQDSKSEDEPTDNPDDVRPKPTEEPKAKPVDIRPNTEATKTKPEDIRSKPIDPA